MKIPVLMCLHGWNFWVEWLDRNSARAKKGISLENANDKLCRKIVDAMVKSAKKKGRIWTTRNST